METGNFCRETVFQFIWVGGMFFFFLISSAGFFWTELAMLELKKKMNSFKIRKDEKNKINNDYNNIAKYNL